MPSVVVRQTVDHLLETAYLKGALDRTRPSQVYIDITSRCNCRCVMCHVWKSEPGDELDPAMGRRPARHRALAGTRHEGQHLRRRTAAARRLAGAARRGHAPGPGGRFRHQWLPDHRRLAATIVDSGVFNVNVSLDSLDPAIHDRLRGVAGTTTKALAAFEHLAAAAARRPDRPVALVRQDDDHGTHPRAGPSGLREQQRLWARRPPFAAGASARSDPSRPATRRRQSQGLLVEPPVVGGDTGPLDLAHLLGGEADAEARCVVVHIAALGGSAVGGPRAAPRHEPRRGGSAPSPAEARGE